MRTLSMIGFINSPSPKGGFMRIFFVLSIMIFLTSCSDMERQKELQAHQQLIRQADLQLKTRIHECTKEKFSRKTAEAQETCIDNAMEAMAQQVNSPYMWVFSKFAAAKYANVAAYADGKITQQEMMVLLKADRAQFDKDLAMAKAQDQRVRQQQALAQQQQEQLEQQQSNLETMQLLGIMQASQPRYYAAPASNTNCVRTGISVNCMSY